MTLRLYIPLDAAALAVGGIFILVDFTLFAQSTFLGSAFAMLGYARRRAGHDLLPSAIPAERLRV